MNKLYSTILPIVMILCLSMLSSCSGSSDETENGGTDDGILRITADKTGYTGRWGGEGDFYS